jgi:hypothetical protein
MGVAKLTDLRLLDEMVKIDCSALYLLSSPATPPRRVRAAVLEAAASGQRVRHAEVKEKVALARRAALLGPLCD